MQSPQDLQATVLELGTLKPEFLGRNIVQMCKKERTTSMSLHREILILASFCCLFCSAVFQSGWKNYTFLTVALCAAFSAN